MQIRQQLAEIKVADKICRSALLIADWTFVLAIDDFEDAVFAKSVATFGDVGIVVRLETNDALSELAYNLLDRDLDLLIEL